MQIIVQHGIYSSGFPLDIFIDAIHFLLDIGVRPVDLNSTASWFNCLWKLYSLRENSLKLMAGLADDGVVIDLQISSTPFLKQNLRLMFPKYGECMRARVYAFAIPILS